MVLLPPLCSRREASDTVSDTNIATFGLAPFQPSGVWGDWATTSLLSLTGVLGQVPPPWPRVSLAGPHTSVPPAPLCALSPCVVWRRLPVGSGVREQTAVPHQEPVPASCRGSPQLSCEAAHSDVPIY